MRTTDFTNRIERLEVFEERMGVRLESLAASLTPGSDGGGILHVRGELHPQSGTELQQDVELVIAAYGTSLRIVGTSSCHFEAEGFFGFEIFDEAIIIDDENLERIRLVPKQAK